MTRLTPFLPFPRPFPPLAVAHLFIQRTLHSAGSFVEACGTRQALCTEDSERGCSEGLRGRNGGGGLSRRSTPAEVRREETSIAMFCQQQKVILLANPETRS